jgi:hypothetical protein
MRNVIFAINITLDGFRLVWLMNIVSSLGQSLQTKEDGCWRVLACRRDCN